MSTYDLVAINWDGTANELDLMNDLGDAVVSREDETLHLCGKYRDAFRFTIRSADLRNTVAHGMACDLGFVAHIEDTVTT